MIKILWFLRAVCYKMIMRKVGSLSYIGKPTYIKGYKQISMGRKTRIYPGARIEAIGIDSKITIGNNTSIGQNLHLISGHKLDIGENVTMSANVFITDIDHTYEVIGKSIMDQPIVIKKTEIGDNCFIGIGAAIQAGTILGKQCIVGSNAVVRGTFPDYCVIVGVPAKIIKRYNEVSGLWEKTNSKGDFIHGEV